MPNVQHDKEGTFLFFPYISRHILIAKKCTNLHILRKKKFTDLVMNS